MIYNVNDYGFSYGIFIVIKLKCAEELRIQNGQTD